MMYWIAIIFKKCIHLVKSVHYGSDSVTLHLLLSLIQNHFFCVQKATQPYRRESLRDSMSPGSRGKTNIKIQLEIW